MFHRYLVLFLLIIPFLGLAQDGNFHLGAPSSGMSNANINSANTWAVFNNAAATASLITPEAVLSYQNRFNIPAFQSVGGGFIFPTRVFVPGMSFYRFGDDAYNKQKVGITLASKLQLVSLGLGINYVQHRFDELGTLNALVIDFGGIAEIVEGIRIGAHVLNVNQASLSNGEKVPTVMRLGLSYVPNDHFILTTELEKDLDLKENLKIGLEYFVTDWVIIRTGFSSEPKSFSFGLGFIALERFQMDYAFMDRNPAGVIHEFSMGYKFRKP